MLQSAREIFLLSVSRCINITPGAKRVVRIQANRHDFIIQDVYPEFNFDLYSADAAKARNNYFNFQ